MRVLLSIACLALITGTASAQQYTHETGTYRYGGTYSKIQTNSAASCAALCAQESVCRSWSFQRATKGFGSATCELKAIVGNAVKNPLMISGINPVIARQAQTGVGPVATAPVRQPEALLGAAQSSPSSTIVRNTVPRALPAAPRPLPPVQNSRPAPLPAPVVQAAPARPIAPAPRIIPAAPAVPATPAPVVIKQPVARPQITPAPVTAAAPSVPREPINAPVTEGQLPQGAVLVQTPPPTVSFAPPTALPPVAAGSAVAAPASTVSTAPPPPPQPAQVPSVGAITPVAPTPAPAVVPTVPETVTFPKRSEPKPTASKLLNTVPAGSVPPAPVAKNKPYQNLSQNKFPRYSVNNITVLTPDQYAQGQATEAAAQDENDQLFETLESVELGDTDLAADIGDPLPPRNERGPGAPGGGGS